MKTITEIKPDFNCTETAVMPSDAVIRRCTVLHYIDSCLQSKQSTWCGTVTLAVTGFVTFRFVPSERVRLNQPKQPKVVELKSPSLLIAFIYTP